MHDEQNMTENNHAPEQSMPTPSNKMGKIWLALLIGLVLGAGIVALLWLYWPKAAATPTPAATSSSSSASTSAPATASTKPACGLNDLSMSVGTADGTAGTIYQHMVFTNKGTTTCTIAGYPVAYMFSASGTALGEAAVPSLLPAPVTITLAPGAKAYTAVGFPEAGNFSSGACTATAATIRVYIPGTAAYLESALAKPNCPGFSSTALASGS